MRLIARYLTATLLALAMVAGWAAPRAAHAQGGGSTLAETCTLNAGTRHCDLTATSGTITLPASPSRISVTVWSYTLGAVPLAAVGPTLVAKEGETLEIALTNNLAVKTSLEIPGLVHAADMAGVAPGASKTYSFSGLRPGTYIYEAGVGGSDGTGPRQVAMGMVGALVVHSSVAATAYGSAATAFDDEAALVYSEIDPNFNNSVDPLIYKLHDYSPKYLLINGKAYPETASIATTAGKTLLLRQVNAGVRFHSIGLLGLRQTIVADDAGLLPASVAVVARTIGAGQTMDGLVRLPAMAVSQTYPLYEAGMPANGASGLNGMGGMLIFIEAAAQGSVPDTTGPQVSNLIVSPASTDGSVNVTISADISDLNRGGSTIASASYSMDGGPVVGFGFTPNTNVTQHLSATLLAANVAGLTVGPHTITVSGTDAAGNPSNVATATLTVVPPAGDTIAPVVGSVTVPTSPSNSITTLALTANVSDNLAVTSATYQVDGGAVVGFPAFTAGANLILSASMNVATLGNGTHTVTVRALDGASNPSNVGSASFVIDRIAPAATIGTFPSLLRPTTPVTIAASASDNLTVTGATYQLDNLTPVAFVFTSGASVSLSASNVSLATLSDGPHTLKVQAVDAAGNAITKSVSFTSDGTAPAINAATLSPTSVVAGAAVALNATITDAVSGVASASYKVDPISNPNAASVALTVGTGGAVQAAISTTGLAAGSHSVVITAVDNAGNSFSLPSLPFTINDQLFVDGFETAPLNAVWSGNTNGTTWTTTGGTRGNLSVTSAAAMKGTTRGLRVTLSNTTTSYVQKTLSAAQSQQHVRFYLNPNGATLGGTRTILSALNGNTEAYRLEMRTSGGAYQIRLVVARQGGSTTSSWYPTTGTIGANTAIEVSWQQATTQVPSASADLYINGVMQKPTTSATHTLTGLTTAAYSVNTLRLGMQTSGGSGSIYLDEVVVTRSSYIGQ